jgi:hypothetical protein
MKTSGGSSDSAVAVVLRCNWDGDVLFHCLARQAIGSRRLPTYSHAFAVRRHHIRFSAPRYCWRTCTQCRGCDEHSTRTSISQHQPLFADKAQTHLGHISFMCQRLELSRCTNRHPVASERDSETPSRHGTLSNTHFRFSRKREQHSFTTLMLLAPRSMRICRRMSGMSSWIRI